MTTPHFYQVLGVARDASLSAIKAAYRRKAKLLHPDSGGDPEDFRRLKLAYDTLSDPEHRRRYDMTGEIPAESPEGREQARLHAMASDLLVEVVSQAGAPEFEDMIELMRKILVERISATRWHISSAERLLKKMTVVSGRIRTDDQSNVLTGLAQKKNEQIRARIAELTDHLEAQEELLNFLQKYSYDFVVESIC